MKYHPTLKGLRVTAYLDKPYGMLGPSQAHFPGVQAVPNLSHQGVIKPFPLNKVEQSQPFAMAVKPAVQNPIKFPLV